MLRENEDGVKPRPLDRGPRMGFTRRVMTWKRVRTLLAAGLLAAVLAPVPARAGAG